MHRRVNFAVALAVVGSFTLPGARPASADDDATVQDVWMLVDAKINGKDLWSPGGRELHWSVSKCPYRIQFKGQVQVDKPTKITYRWERSDGTVLPTQTFDVKKAGSPVDVTPPDPWVVGASGQLFRGAEIFHVLTPSDMSTSTPIKVECE
ncbi:MAG: hypothetical protein ACLQVI_28070 [Polyangiaceae bacterium]